MIADLFTRSSRCVLWSTVGLALGLAGCASKPIERAGGPVPRVVEIAFKGRPGTMSELHYHSHARTRKFAEAQITNDRSEIVDFDVQTAVQNFSENQIASTIKTVKKDGSVPLHDLAFPELGEELDYVMRTDGRILKAGAFPPHSIFFVPSLPTPGRPVEIGDTWPLEHVWHSGRENIPLKLAIIGILKDIVPCEQAYCADIEVSGRVNLAIPPNAIGARFESRLWGRLLFSLDRGDVIWSEMRSREEMAVQADRTIVDSCMVSEIKRAGKGYVSRFDCEPKEQPVAQVPRTL